MTTATAERSTATIDAPTDDKKLSFVEAVVYGAGKAKILKRTMTAKNGSSFTKYVAVTVESYQKDDGAFGETQYMDADAAMLAGQALIDASKRMRELKRDDRSE